MTEIGLNKDKDGAAVTVHGGDATANATLRVDKARVELSAATGVVGQTEIAGGTLYGGAGIVGKAGINYLPEAAAPRVGTAMPIFKDKMNLPQAVALLDEVKLATAGSYNANDITIGKAIELSRGTPAILTPERQARVDKLDAYIEQKIAQAEEARAKLAERLSADNIPQEIKNTKEFGKLQAQLSKPITRDGVDAMTVGQIGDVATGLNDYLKSRGGAKGITNSVDAAVNHAAAQMGELIQGAQTNVANADFTVTSAAQREAERLQAAAKIIGQYSSNAAEKISQLPDQLQAGAVSVHAQADKAEQQLATLGAQAAGVKLSDEQRANLENALARVEKEAERMAERRASPPDPEALRHHHETGKSLMRLDPSAEASAYVAGAFAKPNVPVVGNLVLGGMLQQGLRVDVDNVWAVRSAEDNKLHAKIIPSSVRSSVVFVGIGEAALATPHDVAQRLNLAPRDTGINAGAYAAIRQHGVSLMGVTLEDSRTLEIAGSISQGLQGGNYQAAEVGVSAPIGPKNGEKPSINVRYTRTF